MKSHSNFSAPLYVQYISFFMTSTDLNGEIHKGFNSPVYKEYIANCSVRLWGFELSFSVVFNFIIILKEIWLLLQSAIEHIV